MTSIWPRVGVAVSVFAGRRSHGGTTPLIDLTAVLLVRRGTEPGRGLYCYPGGKLESGEALAAGAAREVLEETGLHVVVPSFAGFFASDVLDYDAAGAIRFHYTLAHMLAYVEVQDERCFPTPTAADDADGAAWYALGARERDDGSIASLARAGLLVDGVDRITAIAAASWATRGFSTTG